MPLAQSKMISGALSNFDHPLVEAKAKMLCEGLHSDREKFLALVEFVREEIPFGFNRNAIQAKASEVLEEGVGYCNSKTNLLLALCKVAGIPARVHYTQTTSEALHGLVWGLPPKVAHAYLEVELEGRWRPVDSYIMDRALCKASLKALEKEHRRLGYGLALDSSPFSIETCIDGEGFVQMGAVVTDFGAYDDSIEFVRTPNCLPTDLNNKGLSGFMYKTFYRSINGKIEKFRRS